MSKNHADRGLLVIASRQKRAIVGADPTDTLQVKFTPGFVLAGIITGAAVAIGSGAVNRWIWKAR